MSKLQKMKHEIFTSDHEIITHVINSTQSSGEYTVCGLDTVSSNFKYNGFEKMANLTRVNLKKLLVKSV